MRQARTTYLRYNPGAHCGSGIREQIARTAADGGAPREV
jgi:hypothetical protein